MPPCTTRIAPALFAALLAAALLGGCAGHRAIGEPCEDSSECASEICVAAGSCPAGPTYEAFCAGARCADGACPGAGQQCIRIGGPAGGELAVCAPAALCPREP